MRQKSLQFPKTSVFFNMTRMNSFFNVSLLDLDYMSGRRQRSGRIQRSGIDTLDTKSSD